MLDGLALDGRVALVTGGAGGIGSAICRDLDAMGAAVVVADVDEAGAERVASSLAHGRSAGLDLADVAAIADLAARSGPVDILVNNAGVAAVEHFVDSDPRRWEQMYRVNMLAPMLLTHSFLRPMIERGWGRVVFISSDSARAGAGGEAVYAAHKSALLGFARSIAREVARAGVTVNAVCPGPTDTATLRGLMDERPQMLDALVRAIPMRRMGQPADVAGMVAYLCSERGGYVTGQTVSVSGGITMA